MREDSTNSWSDTGNAKLIASSLLTLGDDKRVVVCVPSILEATELIDNVEQLGDINLQHVRLFNHKIAQTRYLMSIVYSMQIDLDHK